VTLSQNNINRLSFIAEKWYVSCEVRTEFYILLRSNSHTFVEAGLNTSTMTLRVVGGDETGSLKSETVKYGLETKGLRTQDGLHWWGPVAYTEASPSSHQSWRPTNTDLYLSNSNKTLIVSLDGCFIPGQTGRLTVGRHITLTLAVFRVKHGCEAHGTWSREWTRWRGPAATVNDWPILSSERMLYKDYYRRCSIEKKILAVSFMGLGAKTNWWAVNHQS
jgi:hypothetical protein